MQTQLLCQVLLMAMLLGCATQATTPSTSAPSSSASDYFQHKNLTTVYAVVEQGRIIGYAKRYEWENEHGGTFHCYQVVNPYEQPVGTINDKGLVLQYHPHRQHTKWEKIGHYPLERAIQLLFDVPQLQLRKTQWPQPMAAQS